MDPYIGLKAFSFVCKIKRRVTKEPQSIAKFYPLAPSLSCNLIWNWRHQSVEVNSTRLEAHRGYFGGAFPCHFLFRRRPKSLLTFEGELPQTLEEIWRGYDHVYAGNLRIMIQLVFAWKRIPSISLVYLDVAICSCRYWPTRGIWKTKWFICCLIQPPKLDFCIYFKRTTSRYVH